MRQVILEKGPDVRRRILLITLAGVPVLFLRFVNDPINVPKLALIFIGVSLAGAIKVMELLQGSSSVSLRRAWIPAVAVVGPLFLAWVASPYRGWALLGFYDRFQGLLPYAAVALIAVLVADTFRDRIDQLAWALAISASIVGVYAIVQVAGLDPLVWARAEEAVSDAGSTMGNPNFTGGFLAMTLPLIAALWIARPERRRLVSVLAVAAIAGWIVAFSQGAWAAGAGGLAVAGGVFFAGRARWTRPAGYAAGLVIGVAVIGQVLLGVARGGGPLVPGTVLLRAEAWKGAVSMAAESPILGRGPNTYAIEGTQHRTQADALRVGYDYPNDPHSVFLAMLTSAGVMGAGGFIVLLLWVAQRAARIRDGDIWGAAVLGGIAAYFIQSFVSIDELSIRFTFWTLLGALAAVNAVHEDLGAEEVATHGSRKKRRRKEPLRNPTGVGAVAVVGALILIMTGRFFMADAVARRAVLHVSKGALGDAQQDFERAIELRDEPEYRRLYGLRTGTVALRLPEIGESWVEPVEAAFTFLDQFPHVSMLAERARILQAMAVFDPSTLDGSLEAWQRAHTLDPLNPLIAVEMTSVLLQLERPEDALDVLEKYAEDVGDRFPQYWGALALVRAQTGDEEGADDALARGLALDPEDPWVRDAAITLEEREGSQ